MYSRKIIILYILLVTFIIPYSSSATKIACISVSELLNHADFVALVRIDGGEAIRIEDKYCGAKYRSRVIDGIKGISTGEELVWSTYATQANTNLEIGSSYLIFLNKSNNPFDPLASTNSSAVNRKAEFENICGAALAGNRVAHTGNGALKIETPMLGRNSSVAAKWDQIIRIPSRVLEIPEKLQRIPVEEKGQEVFSTPDVWVNLEDLITYLKTELH